MKPAVFALLLATSCATPVAEQSPAPDPHAAPSAVAVVRASSIAWGAHPFVPGAEMAVVSGDPAHGSSVLLMKFPGGMTIPAHWHTASETVTIVRGSARFGSGTRADAAAGTELEAGSTLVIPARQPHWAITREELVLSVVLDKAADFQPCAEAH